MILTIKTSYNVTRRLYRIVFKSVNMLTKEIIRLAIVVAILLVQIVAIGRATEVGVCELKTGEKARKCSVNEGVNQLLENRNDDWGWGESVEAEVIIALHLAKFTTFDPKKPRLYISVKQMNIDLLSAISRDNMLTSERWGHGKLAYYILGILATCQNPRDFYGHNLVNILKNHLSLSLKYFRSNKFAYSLVVLALCKTGEPVDTSNIEELSTSPGNYTSGVDEAAIVYMAYHCIDDATYSGKESSALGYILDHQDDKGLFGNESSTALAVQAIFTSGNETLESLTKEGITFMSRAIDRREKPFTSLLLSVLPAIAKKSLLDIGPDCKHVQIQTTTPSTPVFTIGITVINYLTSDFNQSWNASLHEGQTMFDALVNLRSADATFSFTSESTTWGPFIKSVCNMTASTDDRQYWQLLDSNNDPLSKGAGQTFPIEGDSYTMKLTTW